jgi:hypothetical protein
MICRPLAEGPIGNTPNPVRNRLRSIEHRLIILNETAFQYLIYHWLHATAFPAAALLKMKRCSIMQNAH